MKNRILELGATVENVQQVSAGFCQITLVCPAIANVVKPGQFIGLKAMAGGTELHRPFSVWHTNKSSIKIIVREVGPNTRLYSKLENGANISVRGPCGMPIKIDQSADLFLLFGGGCGLASLHYLANQIYEQHGSEKLILGAGFTTKKQIFGIKEFEALCKTVLVATDDYSTVQGGTTFNLFENLYKEKRLPANTHIYTCGPRPMMQQIALMAKALGYPCWIGLEEMMACMHGVCKSCAIEMYDGTINHVCEDGPFFRAMEVKSYAIPRS